MIIGVKYLDYLIQLNVQNLIKLRFTNSVSENKIKISGKGGSQKNEVDTHVNQPIILTTKVLPKDNDLSWFAAIASFIEIQKQFPASKETSI